MRRIVSLASLVFLFAANISGHPQVSFGDDSTEDNSDDSIDLRLGLLATSLGIDPLASSGNQQQTGVGQLQTGGSQQQSSIPSATQGPSGRLPTGQQCCCVPTSQRCPAGGDEDFSDFIDSRGRDKDEINLRIVNVPNSGSAPLKGCPAGTNLCCAPANLFPFSTTCIDPQNPDAGLWRQGCSERSVGSSGVKECGRRQYETVSGLSHGQTSPGEFPWTCLLLGEDNSFIGTCAVVPSDSRNDNAVPTRKVITAAHKLKDIGQFDLLKVRIGEYDASGFNPPEQFPHKEYTVVKILKHPNFKPGRLSNNIAILTLNENIDLSQPNVNTACFPSCSTQFNFRFNNGTGTRCWVAGWGKDATNGQFQFIQRKVDVPLVDQAQCNGRLKVALNGKKAGLGDKFFLDSSELCAGGEVGKDACTGDGGSPLVCESLSGRWTVVGLVTWGIGCATDIPGIYVRISEFQSWIDSN